MADGTHPFDATHLTRIEPDERLVVLSRTLQARGPGAETTLRDAALNWARYGETCLGQALYRHRSVFQNASDTPV